MTTRAGVLALLLLTACGRGAPQETERTGSLPGAGHVEPLAKQGILGPGDSLPVRSAPVGWIWYAASADSVRWSTWPAVEWADHAVLGLVPDPKGGPGRLYFLAADKGPVPRWEGLP